VLIFVPRNPQPIVARKLALGYFSSIPQTEGGEAAALLRGFRAPPRQPRAPPSRRASSHAFASTKTRAVLALALVCSPQTTTQQQTNRTIP
jgi:hypothetical protein